MDPITMMMLAQGVGQGASSLFKGVTGVVQGIRANQIRKNAVRPESVTPQGFTDAVGIANNQYSDPRMAGQQYFLDQIGANQATATRGAYQMGGSAAERQNAAIMGQSGANSATSQLAAQAAQQQAQDAAMYMSMLEKLGMYQKQNWQYNKAEPYAGLMAAAQREGDASNTNIAAGLQGLGGAAVGIAGGLNGMGQNPAGGASSLPAFQSQMMNLRPVESGFNPNMQTPQRPVPQALMMSGEFPNEAAWMNDMNLQRFGASFNPNTQSSMNYEDIFNADARNQTGYKSQTGYMPGDNTQFTMDQLIQLNKRNR